MTTHAPRTPAATAALTLAALGVVYGDIGTSPLYAVKAIFHSGGVPLTHDNVLGAMSLIFWLMTVVVSVKYVLLILRADNNGEGGLIALMALAQTAVAGSPRLRNVLLVVGMFGAAILFGDGVVTPAISVLSAVEGLSVVAPGLDRFVGPISLVVLTALFAMQRFGTGGIGRAFGPITLVWFAVLVALGLPQIVRHPQVLVALSPGYAFDFFASQPKVAFVALGAVVLCVTGGEALYADMGHFGRTPIRIAWFSLVMPALVINYFGQGALLLGDAGPIAVENPFFLLAPEWGRLPLVLLATLAAAIASQALISASFSVAKQGVQLGLLPRMRVLHTSVKDLGQIYVPVVNWALYALVLLAVGLFGTSAHLAAAYGIAVTLDMTITTTMTFFVIRYGWRYPLAVCLLATGLFFVVDVTLFLSNMFKFTAGGWFPLAIGCAAFTLMLTWVQGRRLLTDSLHSQAIDLASFLEAVFVSPPTRVAGTAVFLTAHPDLTPNALMHNLKHNKVLHAHNLFVTVQHHEVPWVAPDKRVELAPLGNGCWHATLHFGFKDDPDVPEALQLLEEAGIDLDPMDTSYFLSRDIVMPTVGRGMALWREKLFAGMHRNASGAGDFLNLPANRIVELGSKVEI